MRPSHALAFGDIFDGNSDAPLWEWETIDPEDAFRNSGITIDKFSECVRLPRKNDTSVALRDRGIEQFGKALRDGLPYREGEWSTEFALPSRIDTDKTETTHVSGVTELPNGNTRGQRMERTQTCV